MKFFSQLLTKILQNSLDFKVLLNFKQFLKQWTFFNFSELIIKVNLHRLHGETLYNNICFFNNNNSKKY